MTGRVVISAVSDEPLDVDVHREAVADAGGGAQVVFCGVVRNDDHGRPVTRLEYHEHPDAPEVLDSVARDIAAKAGVVNVAVSHRVGKLDVGDIALVAAVSSAHRGEAFSRCAELVDEVKRQLPIWKRQIFDDGSDEWVNCP